MRTVCRGRLLSDVCAQALGGSGFDTWPITPCGKRCSTDAGSPLMLYALAHWAFGPSRLLEQVTEQARAAVMPGLMDGTVDVLLSEPNAGSDASMIKHWPPLTETGGASAVARF